MNLNHNYTLLTGEMHPDKLTSIEASHNNDQIILLFAGDNGGVEVKFDYTNELENIADYGKEHYEYQVQNVTCNGIDYDKFNLCKEIVLLIQSEVDVINRDLLGIT